MAESVFFRKAVGVANTLALGAGTAVLAACLLTLLPSAGRYLNTRAFAATVQPGTGERPAANAVNVEQSGDRAKLIFELSAPLDATAFVLAKPDRVIVNLPQIDFALDPETGKAADPRRKTGLIAAFRFGQLAPGKSRIVINLAAPALVLSAACGKLESDGHARLVIELAKTDRRSFEAAVQRARIQLAALAQSKEAPTPAPDSAKPVIMIDPGHGGIDRGAMVHGLIEKELVFDFAKAVAAKLDADGRFKVAMTRDDDSFVSLSERVRMARERNAALFVSIHADTLSSAADVSGATVYTVSDRASDAEAARVAEKENQADAAAGLDKTEDASDVSGILFDLTRRETRAYSQFFAHTLVNYWRVAGRLNKNPRRSAGFLVLKAPDVPSVLLELGYLSNEKDGLALTSARWRDKASSQVAEAIKAFFTARESSATATKTDPDRAAAEKIPSAGP
jgi:N-acetylmuramoyl-L-alanine amidase